MFSRLLHVLVLGLLMYRPRPSTPTGGPPTPPPGVDDADFPDFDSELLDPIEVGPFRPSHPPTAPPGHTGEWPPRTTGTRRPAPPTPPPGHDGEWPPRHFMRPGILGSGPNSMFERARELMLAAREIQFDPRMAQMQLEQQRQATDGADSLADGT